MTLNARAFFLIFPMNIFFLHTNGWVMAMLHCDSHVSKMILEIAQLASNVYHHYDSHATKLYKKTHTRHPMSIFMCQNVHNFTLCVIRGIQIAKEYTLRFNRVHSSELMLHDMLSCPPDFTRASPPEYSEGTAFGSYGPFMIPLCIADRSLHHTDACVAYTQYYLDKLMKIKRLRRWRKKTTLALPLAIRMARQSALST